MYLGGTRGFYSSLIAVSIGSMLIVLSTLHLTSHPLSKMTGIDSRILYFTLYFIFLGFSRVFLSLFYKFAKVSAKHYRVAGFLSSITFIAHLSDAVSSHLGWFERLGAEFGLISSYLTLSLISRNQLVLHTNGKSQDEMDALQLQMAQYSELIIGYQRQLDPDSATVFPNLDGNCYMNAVVQALLALDGAEALLGDDVTEVALKELLLLKHHQASSGNLDAFRMTMSEEHQRRPVGRKLGGHEELFMTELIDRLPRLREATRIIAKDFNDDDIDVHCLGLTGEATNVDISSITENFPIFGDTIDQASVSITGIVKLPQILIVNSGRAGSFRNVSEVLELRDRSNIVTYKLKSVIQKTTVHAWAHVFDANSDKWYNIDNVFATPIRFEDVADHESLHFIYQKIREEVAPLIEPVSLAHAVKKKAVLLNEAVIQVFQIFLRDLDGMLDMRFLADVTDRQKQQFLHRIAKVNVEGVVALTCFRNPPAGKMVFFSVGKNRVAAAMHAVMALKSFKTTDLEFSRIHQEKGSADIFEFLETLRNPDGSLPVSGYLEILLEKIPCISLIVDSVEMVTELPDVLILRNSKATEITIRGEVYTLRSLLGSGDSSTVVIIEGKDGWIEIDGLVSRHITLEEVSGDQWSGIYERS